jgi:short-subunit dehydrogenase
MAKTWFITDVSKGFGREWAEAALERGDAVAATARNLKTLDTLVKRYGRRLAAPTRCHRPEHCLRDGEESLQPLRQARCRYQ